MDREVTILYEDAELIVCHKPAGIAVQSARVGQKDMVSILNNHLAESCGNGRNCLSGKKGERQSAGKEAPTVYVVHRLDQPVEGVLVFAKTKRAAAELSRQAADGSMKKIYQAVCCVADGNVCAEEQKTLLPDGSPPGEHPRERRFENGKTYDLVDYLVKDGRTNTSSVAEKGGQGAKRAELSFRVIACRDALLLSEIELKTGRHHQIRVQMAHAGLPLYGDRKYNESWEEYLTEADKARLNGQNSGTVPLALCAVSLAFSHPASREKMAFETKPRTDIFLSFFPY